MILICSEFHRRDRKCDSSAISSIQVQGKIIACVLQSEFLSLAPCSSETPFSFQNFNPTENAQVLNTSCCQITQGPELAH